MKASTNVATAVVMLLMGAGASAVTEGVKGTTVRPGQVEAKIKSCQIAKPGTYEVTVGDLIELDYTYPVVPEAIPKKVDHHQTLLGAIVKSSLGFRSVVIPQMVGAGTIAFYFDAKSEGEETVTLIIDKAEYVYRFKVKK